MLSLGCKARLIAAPSSAAPWAMTLSSSREAQPGRVQMSGAAGLGGAEAGVGKLQRPAQPLRLRRTEAVHADEGRGPHLPHQRPGQLL